MKTMQAKVSRIEYVSIYNIIRKTWNRRWFFFETQSSLDYTQMMMYLLANKNDRGQTGVPFGDQGGLQDSHSSSYEIILLQN